MAITKETAVAKIEVVTSWKHLQVAYDTIIKEDGIVIGTQRSRDLLQCGHISDDESNTWSDTNISHKEQEIQDVANLVWTQEIKDSWKAKLIAQKVI